MKNEGLILMNFAAWRKYLNDTRDILMWVGSKLQLLNLIFLKKIGLWNITDSNPKSNSYKETTGIHTFILIFYISNF